MEKRYEKKLQDIIDQVLSYNPEADVDFLKRTFEFAYEGHRGQHRRSGEPFVDHCLEVAQILADLKLDYITIAAGFLHDVAEDTNINIQEIEENFGFEIGMLVNGLTKIAELRFESREVRQAENFRKMLLSMTEDLRIILIKFADRLHNMRTLEHLSPKTQERIARETLDVYAPLAHRFGIAMLKSEMEDLALKILDKEAYREIEKKVAVKRQNREEYIERIANPIRRELERLNISAQVHGRAKHFYSIYMKMKHRGKSFEEILDLIAMRIIVMKVEECYFVLGAVHSLFTPMHEKLTDYIAAPKPNGYQSLHTKVIGPDGRLIEIQIRTQEMDDVAEVGIAAHWQYKEGKAAPDEIDSHARWLRQVLDSQVDATSSAEFMENLKINLFQDEIFVFTPKGKLITLAKESTPIDFAFAVHTDIGLHTTGAKVNNKIVPLSSELCSGDSVEIITSPNQKPSIDWLKFVKSSRARSRIRRYLKEAQFEQSAKLGNELLERELARLKIKRDRSQLEDIAESFGHSDIESLYAAVGSGDISAQNVIRKLVPEDADSDSNQTFFERIRSRLSKEVKGIRVQGLDNMMVNFAKCCRPLPGDKITGFITTGKGITVHRTDCRNIERLLGDPERNVQVEWDADIESQFNARIRLVSEDRPKLLRDVTDAIASFDVNISAIDMRRNGPMAVGDFIFEVHNLRQLVKIIRAIRGVKGVVSVDRLDQAGDEDLLVDSESLSSKH